MTGTAGTPKAEASETAWERQLAALEPLAEDACRLLFDDREAETLDAYTAAKARLYDALDPDLILRLLKERETLLVHRCACNVPVREARGGGLSHG